MNKLKKVRNLVVANKKKLALFVAVLGITGTICYFLVKGVIYIVKKYMNKDEVYSYISQD